MIANTEPESLGGEFSQTKGAFLSGVRFCTVHVVFVTISKPSSVDKNLFVCNKLSSNFKREEFDIWGNTLLLSTK